MAAGKGSRAPLAPPGHVEVGGGVVVHRSPNVLAGHHLGGLLDLDWMRVGDTPRDEYFVSKHSDSYTYGAGAGRRTYDPMPWTVQLNLLHRVAESEARCKFDYIFLNHYRDGKDQLGWHADDSPEMDDSRPILIMSFGQEREIWFRENASPGDIYRASMPDGSMLVMPPGMQDTHQHRIPKSHLHECGPRVSLTFRGKAKAP
jgi:alkylated DNA repair dioxygenase AlkB